jgi:hypothetical protein
MIYIYMYPYTGSINSTTAMSRYNDQKTTELLSKSHSLRDKSNSPSRFNSPTRANSFNKEDSIHRPIPVYKKTTYTSTDYSKTKGNFITDEKKQTPTSNCECNILNYFEYIGFIFFKNNCY